MEYTPNLNLKKPGRTDPVLIGDLNYNMDILDQEVKDIRDTLDQEVGDIRDILDNLFVEEGELLDE